MLTSSIKKGRIPIHRGSEMPTWKEKLDGRMDPLLAEEIDVFETQMVLRRQGKLDEKIFAETRLRRGCYGQRYDNGHRHDGILETLSSSVTKFSFHSATRRSATFDNSAFASVATSYTLFE